MKKMTSCCNAQCVRNLPSFPAKLARHSNCAIDKKKKIYDSLLMTVATEFEAANKKYVGTFDKGDVPLPPGRKALVLVRSLLFND